MRRHSAWVSRGDDPRCWGAGEIYSMLKRYLHAARPPGAMGSHAVGSDRACALQQRLQPTVLMQGHNASHAAVVAAADELAAGEDGRHRRPTGNLGELSPGGHASLHLVEFHQRVHCAKPSQRVLGLLAERARAEGVHDARPVLDLPLEGAPDSLLIVGARLQRRHRFHDVAEDHGRAGSPAGGHGPRGRRRDEQRRGSRKREQRAKKVGAHADLC
mmetsp:Transcript_8001/g.19895  ORF Transcript_8001/g.19895 Transcript_8001/m.19895 type:complete len:216 (-) Transcript_8001:20-667(-)